MLERRSRRGKLFYGCDRYPKCKFASWDKLIAEKCPQCGAPYLLEKTTKRDGTTWRCAKAEECGYKAPAPEKKASADESAPASQPSA